ncbi:MAG: flagellar basal body protein [Rhodospirillum sp.]|nr:flagellar basal body protein [Rhodospirillum sp.]MCF8489054.1 flagellar basal body protein [Rhodospirillum sp.]MCF8499757.1 flagellar basal body protein [Rhodospirillum sp.]
MDVGLSIAVSGLKAAETRVNVAANNLVNQRSDAPLPATNESYQGYQPQRVDQRSEAPGTRAVVSPIVPAYVSLPDGEGGTRAGPNVDVTGNVVELQTAGQAYKAAASVIRTQEEMSKEALDILS